MDDTKIVLITFALLVSYACAGVARAELAYVSPAAATNLQRRFDAAHASLTNEVLVKTKWTCTMYGVRSKMQVQQDVELYVFSKPKPEQARLENTGAAPIAAYERQGDVLEGHDQTKGLLDEVRVTADRHLIAKLSLPSQKLVLAFAECTGS